MNSPFNLEEYDFCKVVYKKETQECLDTLLKIRSDIQKRYEERLNPKTAVGALRLERERNSILAEYRAEIKPIDDAILEIKIKSVPKYVFKKKEGK